MADKKEISRKDFFKSAVGYFLDTVSEITSTTNPQYQPAPIKSGLFRPPGALPEEEFLIKCTRCDKCINACAKHALIRFNRPDSENHGTPILIFRKSACVLCDTFPCASACDPKALIIPASIKDVKIGHAVIFPNHCIAWQGQQPCEHCYNACPFPDVAISLDEMRRPVISKKDCAGCGLCVQNCPSSSSGVIIFKNP